MTLNPWVGFGLAAGAVGAGIYALTRGGHHGHLSGSRRRRSHLRGQTEVAELTLFIENDGQLYHSQTQPIIKNLQRKYKKGVYDPTKAEKLWMYLVESGAKKYAKDEAGGGVWHKMFSMADRKAAARDLRERYEEQVKE